MIPLNEIEEELQFHIEERAADLERRGMPAAEALRRARIEFGSVARFVEEGREARGWRAWDLTVSSLAAAWRGVRRRPAEAIASVLALALAGGAATLFFSMAATARGGRPAYPEGERIYNVRLAVPPFAALYTDVPVTARHYGVWRRECAVCESMALIGGGLYRRPGDAEPLLALEVTPEFFALLGERGFTAADQGQAAVLTDRGWRERFGGDPEIVGRVVELNGRRVRIAGILKAGTPLPRGEQWGELMQFPSRVDLLMPLAAATGPEAAADQFQWAMLVKLRPGVTAAEAEAVMSRATRGLDLPATAGQRPVLVPLDQQWSMAARQPLQLLEAIAVVLALLVGAQFANLQWASLAARRRELAIRSMMGASRADLLRHSLSEAVALALAGNLMGWALAAAALRLAARLLPEQLPRVEAEGLSATAAAMAAAMTVLPAVIGIAVQMWRSWRAPEAAGDEPGERRVTGVVVFASTAASVVLAGAAALLGSSYVRLRGEDPGFAARQMTVLCVTAPTTGQGGARARHDALLERLRRLPGVAAAGSSNRVPLAGEAILDPVSRAGEPGPMAAWRSASPGYFAAAGTAIVAGREFTAADRGAHVAILSRRAARELFGGESPLGRTVRQQSGEAARVIGVAEDARAKRLDAEGPPMVYLPDWQFDAATAYYVLRGAGDDADLGERARREALAFGMEAPAERMQPMERMVDRVTTVPRWESAAALLLAGAAVAATSLGLFAVVAFAAGRRTPEVGLRMALGATRRQAVRALAGELLRPVWLGVAAGGTLTAIWASECLAPRLYAAEPAEAAVLAVAFAAVAAPAAAAGWYSIHRAVRLNPVEALRSE